MRGNLFVKIFLGFWLVIITIIISWSIAGRYFDAQPSAEAGPPRPGPPRQFMLRLIYDMQNLPDQKLRQRVEEVEQQHNMRIFLLDHSNRDIYGREYPPGVLRVARHLREGRRRSFHESEHGHLLGHLIYRQEQGLLRAVLVMQPRRHGVVKTLGEDPRMRLLLAVLISGLVCYLLSRWMTRRLKDLRGASRRLAQGELDTRIAVRERGGDETDDLARDFNSMAEQLQQRMQAQRRLLSDVSHELRSPLARLRIALALAQEDKPQAEQHLARIEQEAERLEDLISQLLSSSSGDAELDDHIDLVALLTELAADATFEGKSAGKLVSFNADLEQAVVASTGDLLKKSFENLLRNALNYSPDDSVVTVQLHRDDNSFVVYIEDQGPGVPEAELARIFDEFYRVDTARARQSGGYGLGLSIARRAISHHGGDISARNTGHGLGVTVRLPVANGRG